MIQDIAVFSFGYHNGIVEIPATTLLPAAGVSMYIFIASEELQLCLCHAYFIKKIRKAVQPRIHSSCSVDIFTNQTAVIDTQCLLCGKFTVNTTDRVNLVLSPGKTHPVEEIRFSH